MNLKYFLKKYSLSLSRARYITLIFIIILIITWSYIGYLQLYKGSEYHSQSVKNFTRKISTYGIRGAIFDKNNKIFAVTRPVIQLIWNKQPRNLTQLDMELLDFLTTHFKITDKELLSLYEKNEEKTFMICSEVKFEQLSILLEKYPQNPRILVSVGTKRSYPLAPAACHIIGYLGASTENGLAGIERAYNETLLGKEGLEESIVNAQGKTVETINIAPCSAGLYVKTTLDFKAQMLLEEAIPDNIKGCAILMNPENGDILASISSPRFNPALFLDRISQETWSEINKNQALINKCTEAHYPPASLFKLVTATAMLEEGFADSTTEWFCNGHVEYRGRKYHCHKREGHGKVNIKKAIYCSCNIPFYTAAINGLSIDTIALYAQKLGLGAKTGISLPEGTGLIPTKEWKKRVKKEKWYTGETLSVAIGQGAAVATPLQLARMVGGIMTGYLIKPRILESEELIKTPLSISSATRNLLKAALYCSITEGTARPLRNLSGWEIYPKTGTAQLKAFDSNEVADKSENIKESLRHHGWLACYAKYKKQPPVVLLLIMENVGSSTTVAAYARNFLYKYGLVLEGDSQT